MISRRRMIVSTGAFTVGCGAAGGAPSQRPIVPVLAPSAGGGPPDGFSILTTGRGGLPDWESIPDPDHPGAFVLAQEDDDPTEGRYPLAIYHRFSGADVDVSMRFKAIAGKVDRAGGIAVRWRYGNYYCAFANALSGTVVFQRVVNGHVHDVEVAVVEVASGVWHDFGLRALDSNFVVSFDGKAVLTVTDRTFAGAGMVALCTKADSVMWFSDLALRAVH